jgi:hypothetical protein
MKSYSIWEKQPSQRLRTKIIFILQSITRKRGLVSTFFPKNTNCKIENKIESTECKKNILKLEKNPIKNQECEKSIF